MKLFVYKIMSAILTCVMCVAIIGMHSVEASESFEVNEVTYHVLDRDSVEVKKYDGRESTVVIPEEVHGYKVRTISVAAFDGNKYIKKVTLPKSIEKIEKLAFRSSTLEQIDIPEYIEKIGYFAFEDTPLYENAGDIKYVGNVCLGVEEDCNLKEINIKEGTRVIADGAFTENQYITKVQLPYDLMYIGEAAFERCTNLTTINIPYSAKNNIGLYAFYKNKKLTNVSGDIEYLENTQAFLETPLQAKKHAKEIVRTTFVLFAFLVCFLEVVLFGKLLLKKEIEKYERDK